MPGLAEESGAILEWLAREVSPDTWVNVMGQYRPAGHVGEPGAQGVRFAEIDRLPRRAEMEAVYEAGRRSGLWRFDVRPGPAREA
jgi:putative pyruvate formate lyase activating enzyme